MSLIAAHNLTFNHAPGRGVDRVSLELEKGSALALLGHNGSGKTTLTSLVCGLLRPQSGSLSIFGKKAGVRSTANLARMGICLDSGHLWEGLSGWDNAYFAVRSRGVGDEAATEQLEHFFRAAELDGQAKDPVKTYSFGMRRKVSLIQALTGWPELLILDEPTTGLDSAFIRFLSGHIRARNGHGLTTWLASNDPGFCQKAAREAAFFHQGKLIARGRIKDLIARAAPFKEVRIGLESGAEEVDLAAFSGLNGPGWLKSLRRQEDDLYALIEDRAELVPRLMEGLVGLGVELKTLEVKGGGLAQALELAVSEKAAEGPGA